MSEVQSAPQSAPAPQTSGDQVGSSRPQAASSDEPITVAGGDSIVSFDELEAVTSRDQRQKKEPKEKPKEKPKKAEKSEAVEEAEESEEADEESGDSTEPKGKPKDKEKSEQKEVKRLKAKDGEQELDLSVNATIPVKINGREEHVSVEELRNNYAGKVVWDRKFHELDKERRAFQSERTTVETKLQGFFKQHETDPLGAYFSLAKESGYDVVKLKQDFFNAASETIEKFNSMSEDEKQRHWLEEENRILKAETESARAKQMEIQARTQITSTVERLQETHQITPQQFSETYFELEKLQEAGQIEGEITPDMVAQVHLHKRNYIMLRSSFDEMKLNLSEAEREGAIREIMQHAAKFPELTTSDLKDIAQQIYGLDKAKNLSRRVIKNKGAQAVKSVEKPRNPASEPLFFDDL